MKWIRICLIMLSFKSFGQGFGEFASAVAISKCGTVTQYNLTGSGSNCINSNCSVVFNGVQLGTFTAGSNELSLVGGELKSWKSNSGNVCGGQLFYTIYPTGFRPSSPVFSAINFPFKANCSNGVFTDGLGPCGGNDQKWGTLTNSVNLTNLANGNYALEVYIAYYGHDFINSSCSTTKYISNSGLNYVANFSIGSNSVCNVTLPVELTSFDVTCSKGTAHVTWQTSSEYNSDYFVLYSSADAINFDSVITLKAAGFSNHTINYDVEVKSNRAKYFLLEEVDFDGANVFFGPISNWCEEDSDCLQFVLTGTELLLLIHSNENYSDDCTIKVVAMNGREIAKVKRQSLSNPALWEINNQLEPGIYFVEYIDPVFEKYCRLKIQK